jgi:hypothetical protein
MPKAVRSFGRTVGDYRLLHQRIHVIGWLEMEFAPPAYARETLDELDRLTEAWVEDHQRKPTRAKNGPELAALEWLHSTLCNQALRVASG